MDRIRAIDTLLKLLVSFCYCIHFLPYLSAYIQLQSAAAMETTLFDNSETKRPRDYTGNIIKRNFAYKQRKKYIKEKRYIRRKEHNLTNFV